MQPTPDFDPGRLAKSLLRRSRQGALATLMVGSGAPYCSLVNLASHPDGSPILLISALAVHTRNILADSRVSLMLDERAAGIRRKAPGSCCPAMPSRAIRTRICSGDGISMLIPQRKPLFPLRISPSFGF